MRQLPSDTTRTLLNEVTSPAALRALPAGQLPELAADIRSFLVEKVRASGGHLGPNLGVVELTLALHRVFTSPLDSLLFDTGHQAYVHKILTGRQGLFDALRQAGGMSGYPSRAESAHDCVENSHASTVLSYADGLAKARALSGEQTRAVVAVIGDGALTGGMALEALNNLGSDRSRPVIVVLNDNGRSYSVTTGGIPDHLSALKAAGPWRSRRNLFTDLGFTYLGPVDGHDTAELESVLHQARATSRPVLVHVLTVKGKGYAPAETDEADCLHAVGAAPARTYTGTTATARRSWTSVFGQTLVEMAAERPDLVAVTAAMLRPTGLHAMQQKYPERVFDVGIAEQHAVGSAAGLAMGGCHPVVALYATFFNRAYDQALLDVALHRLPVTFVLDRAGITGPDGPSHHGMWDLSLLSSIPGMRVAVPRDARRLREQFSEAVRADGPTALRIPKATAGDDVPALARMDGIDILYRSRRRALDVLIVPIGPLASAAVDAAAGLEREGIGVTVADPGWVCPVNPALPGLAARHSAVFTVEDGIETGGIGTAIAQACREAGTITPVTVLGLPTAFIPHGTRHALLVEAGLDSEGIARAVRAGRAGRPADRAPTPDVSDAVPATSPESR